MSDVTVGKIIIAVLALDTAVVLYLVIGGWLHDLRQKRRWQRYYEWHRRQREFEKIERFANRES